MNFLLTNIKKLLAYDDSWCRAMGFFNPYIDPYDTFLTAKLEHDDFKAAKAHPMHARVYDKLWIAQTQGIQGGLLSALKNRKKYINFPIFIKPRWGHISASSKNCYKINKYEELKPYFNYPDMIWTEFIDAREGMTDFVLLNGQIVYQFTYRYSDKQNGFTEDWKYISPNNKPPVRVTEWIQTYIPNYNGIVNIQYRNNKIIEVSLRLARAGAYITSTQNKALIKNINSVIENQKWDHSLEKQMKFKPFFSFKCYTNMPIIYLYPQYFIDIIMKGYGSRPFYEYYFEPDGKDGLVVFQFLHDDFEAGMKLKKLVESLINIAQYSFFILLFSMIIFSFFDTKISLVLLVVILILFIGRLLNPIIYNYNLLKAQKQKITGGGPPAITKENILY